METILNTESEVTDISQRFQDFTVDDNQFSEHLKNSTAFSMKLKKSKKKLQKFLECHPELPIPIKKISDDPLDWIHSIGTTRLDPLDWKSFKEKFEAAVHGSDSISNIEKFTYLKTYLDKSALQAIEGFTLTNENYTAAWQLLDERYRNNS